MECNTAITPEKKSLAEKQLTKLQKEINYDTKDYSIEFLINKYKEDEFYIPPYQRKFIWDENTKNRFIESVLLGLPIPFMFFSDNDDGKCEIIDGAQRTQTLEEFLDNTLMLSDLKKLTELNGFTFEDLPVYYQRKFKNRTLRIVVLADSTSLEVRQDIFNRINTGGKKANDSEIRRGSHTGPFMELLKNCSDDETFLKLCPISESMKKRYEHLELVLRFFAFLNNYQNFDHRVDDFLDDFLENHVEKAKDASIIESFRTEFNNMLTFIKNNFPNGFAKTKGAKSTPRVRFEAISVGVALALRERPALARSRMDWLESEDFKYHTTTHASNSQSRVKGRIEFVKNSLLEGDMDAGNN